ncbi:MAG: hypothetical protein WC717_06325 [Candidatus Micrarchaeia archaeon]
MPYKDKAARVNGYDHREPILFFNRVLDYRAMVATKERIDNNVYSKPETVESVAEQVLSRKTTIVDAYANTNILALAARYQKVVKLANKVWGACLAVAGAATTVFSSAPVAAAVGVPAVLGGAPAFVPIIGGAVFVLGVTLLAMGFFATPKKEAVSTFQELANGSGKTAEKTDAALN